MKKRPTRFDEGYAKALADMLALAKHEQETGGDGRALRVVERLVGRLA